MKRRSPAWIPWLLALGASVCIAHALADLASVDPDASVDLGGGLVLTPDKKVVEAWALPGATSEAEAAYAEATDALPRLEPLRSPLLQPHSLGGPHRPPGGLPLRAGE